MIISSFHCEHCGYENNEVQSASAVQEEGIDIAVKVSRSKRMKFFPRVIELEYIGVEGTGL